MIKAEQHTQTKFFIDKGVKEEEIIISPVEYLDKKTVALSAIPYPGELLIKDNAFKNQSLGLYAQAKQNEVPESCYKETSKEEYLEVLQDIIENKYHVKLLCEDEKVTVVGVDAELWKKIDEAQEPDIIREYM